MRERICGLLGALVATAVIWSLAVGCGEQEGAHRVELETSIMGVGGVEPFTNEPPTGIEAWTITLDSAVAALGPVYLFEGDPLLGSLDLRRLILPLAYAHPGHYQEGEAMGELREQSVIDLLATEPTDLGPMNAVSGTCHSAQIGVGTAESGLAGTEVLEGHAILLRGEASRGDETVLFDAWLDVDLFVEGLDFEHEIDSAPGHLRIDVDLRRWLRRVDFDTAVSSDGPGSPVFLEEGSQAHNALSRGVDNTLAYALRWEPEGEM